MQPELVTIEAIRAMMTGSEDVVEVVSGWMDVAEDNDVDEMLAVGMLLRDAYAFAAMLVHHLANRDGVKVNELLDGFALMQMQEA